MCVPSTPEQKQNPDYWKAQQRINRMGGGVGDSLVVPDAQRRAQEKQDEWVANQVAGAEKANATEKARRESILSNPPPLAPDLTDDVIQAAGSAERKRQQTGRTRRSTFITGEPGTTGKTTIGGM